MGSRCCFFLIIIVQLASARVPSNGFQNRAMPIGMNARELPNGMPYRGVPNGFPYSNQFMNQMPAIGNSLSNANFPNKNMAAANNIVNANLANANANMAQASLINANANQVVTNNAVAPAVISEQLSFNVLPNTSPAAILPNNEDAAKIAKGSTARSLKLSIGNPLAMKNCIHGKIGNQNFGLQIIADNLDIAGTVSVTGSMPIYGTVTVNGNVPSDGNASVDYGCGSPKRTLLSM